MSFRKKHSVREERVAHTPTLPRDKPAISWNRENFGVLLPIN